MHCSAGDLKPATTTTTVDGGNMAMTCINEFRLYIKANDGDDEELQQ